MKKVQTLIGHVKTVVMFDKNGASAASVRVTKGLQYLELLAEVTGRQITEEKNAK